MTGSDLQGDENFLNDGKPQTNLPRSEIVFHTADGLVRITAQVASTSRQRQKGLMFTKHLDDSEGMLFVFEKEEPLAFWMKNTYIPLDMIFLDSRRTVVGVVEGAIPFDTSPRGIGRPARYVIEVPAGFVSAHKISTGTKVEWKQAGLR